MYVTKFVCVLAMIGGGIITCLGVYLCTYAIKEL